MYLYIYCMCVFVFLDPTFSFHINAFRGVVNWLTPCFPKLCIEKKRTIQYVVQ